jgi:hypothetical protein
MGYYINYNSKGIALPACGKANALIADGAKEVSGNNYEENLVCVVENGLFDAAMYCYLDEYEYVKSNPDNRKKRWLVYEHAKQLCGYDEAMNQKRYY